MTRRATRDGEPARNLTIRVYDEDRATWEAAVEADSARSLSSWITEVCNEAAAKRQSKRSKT